MNEENNVEEVCNEIYEYVKGNADFHTEKVEAENVPVEVWTLASYDSNIPDSEVYVTIGFDDEKDEDSHYYSSLTLSESQWRKLSGEVEEIIKLMKEDNKDNIC